MNKSRVRRAVAAAPVQAGPRRAASYGDILDLTQLRSLVAVGETGSFTQAAARFDCTQAAISQQIQRLERQLGTPLVRRSQRAVALTDEGERLAHYGRRLLALNDEALASLEPGALRGTVRIGAMDYDAVNTLPTLLAGFSASHPEVRIQVITGLTHDLERMLGPQLDLLIAPELEPSGEVLRTEQMCWIHAGGERLLAQRPLPVALLHPGSFLRDAALKALAHAPFAWHLAYECSNMPTMLALVATRRAVGVGSGGVVHGRIKAVRRGDVLPPLPSFSVTLRDAGKELSRAATALRQYLLQFAHRLPELTAAPR